MTMTAAHSGALPQEILQEIMTRECNMTPKEHAAALIQKSAAILVAVPQKPSIDDAASALAFAQTIGALGKKTSIACGEYPAILKTILPQEIFSGAERPLADFIIRVNTAGAPVGELKYEKEGDALKIILTPKHAPIGKELVTFENGAPKSDLVVIFGANALEDLGNVFESAASLFYETPAIAFNEFPGHDLHTEVDMSDPTKSSVAELTAEFLLSFAPQAISKEAATALLAGMIEKTKNFRNQRTKPSALSVAASLMERGADKDAIVRSIEKTAALPLLHIWGRAAIRSRRDDTGHISIVMLTAEDFTKTGAIPKDALPFVIERLEEHFRLPEFFALFWQQPADRLIRVIFHSPSSPALDALSLPYPQKSGYRALAHAFSSFPLAEREALRLLGREQIR